MTSGILLLFMVIVHRCGLIMVSQRFCIFIWAFKKLFEWCSFSTLSSSLNILSSMIHSVRKDISKSFNWFVAIFISRFILVGVSFSISIPLLNYTFIFWISFLISLNCLCFLSSVRLFLFSLSSSVVYVHFHSSTLWGSL